MNASQHLREHPLTPVLLPRVRVLITMPVLDGYHHDVKLIARALLDAGHEVICTGMRRVTQPPAAAIPADKPIVGLSFFPGARPPITAKATSLPTQRPAPGDRAEVGGHAAASGVPSNAVRACIVFTRGAEITDIVKTLDRFGVGICGVPERSC
jgi:methylmalonyl-CoA mutase cobalamin-binding domain/chain